VISCQFPQKTKNIRHGFTQSTRINLHDLSVLICENPWLLSYLSSHSKLEVEADASGDESVAPVVNVIGIIEVGFELEITQLVGAFYVPAAEVVSDGAADGVSVVEVGLEEGLRAVGRGMKARRKFRRAFDAGEGAIVGSEFVLHKALGFEQFHVIAIEDHSAVGDEAAGITGWRNKAANLNMNASGKMLAEVKSETAVYGLLGCVIRSVLGPAHFAASDDIRTVLAVGAFPDDDFAVNAANGAGDAGLPTEMVGGFPEVDADGSVLSIGWKRGEERPYNCGDK
jgi:hypothetical protein